MESKTKLNKSELLEVFLQYKDELLCKNEKFKLKSSNDEVFFKIENHLSKKMSRKYIYLTIKKMSLEIFGEIMQNNTKRERESDEFKPESEPHRFDVKFSVNLENGDLNPIETKFRKRVRQTPPADWTEKITKLLWSCSQQSIVCCFFFKSGSYLSGEFVTEGKYFF